MPSASRIDAFSGSSVLRFLERDGRLGRHPGAKTLLALAEERVGVYARSLSTSSRIAAAIVAFDAFGTRALAVARDEDDLVLADVEPDVGATDVVEDDEVGVLRLEHRALPRQPLFPVLGAERDEHLARALALAERARDVGRRLELDRPAAVVLRPLGGERLGRAGSRRPRPRAARCRRPAARAPRRASAPRSASGSSRRRAAPARTGWRRAGSPPPRAGAPLRRARRPSGPRSGCRRSARCRAARASRRR